MKTRLPDEVRIFTDIDNGRSFDSCDNISDGDLALSLKTSEKKLSVFLSAVTTPVFHIRFRWNFIEGEKRRRVKVMGDAWERSYGDLEWRGVVPQRFMPWYMLVSDGDDEKLDVSGRYTEAFGVEVRPGAFCTWQYDTHGVTLWMDVRCGGDGVILGGRTLHVCNIIMKEYRDVSAFEAGKLFCREMCKDPLTPQHTVYGFNNWYYAVGDSSHEQILRDADLIASLTEGIENRPYCVVDDGWQINPCDGPWEKGNEKFPDMARLAEEITDRGCRPGIWIRPLLNETLNGVTEDMCIQGRCGVLDPSLPEVIDHIKGTIKRLTSWGYKLIKHDFVFIDMFATNGFDSPKWVTPNGWSFHDRSRTSAEIALDLFRAILEVADDDTIILACDTPSHLTAGLAHLMRTGFDTSSRHFERTRISGVNTLAFRLMQNGTFYVVDADCVCHAGRIDWKLNREWLNLVADSGTALFISSDPALTGEEQIRDMIPALAKGSHSGNVMVPLDWMNNQTPEYYLVNGEEKHYSWYSEEGTRQFIPPKEQIY